MERSKKKQPQVKANEPALQTFINTGSPFRLPRRANKRDGLWIKTNQRFQALPSEVPEAFRDIIKPIGIDIQAEAVKEVRIAPAPAFTTKLKSPGYYDVVNSEGKVMNEKALRKDAADSLVKKLTGENNEDEGKETDEDVNKSSEEQESKEQESDNQEES